MTDDLVNAAQAARIAELEAKLADLEEVDESLRGMVRMYDHYKAKFEAAEARAAELEERVHYAEGTADTNINRANEAEARAEWLREALTEIAKEDRAANCRSRKWLARAALNTPEPEYTQEDWDRVYKSVEAALDDTQPEGPR
jgi:predicted  nucleic acid-binding Zn-ribbon protein